MYHKWDLECHLQNREDHDEFARGDTGDMLGAILGVDWWVISLGSPIKMYGIADRFKDGFPSFFTAPLGLARSTFDTIQRQTQRLARYANSNHGRSSANYPCFYLSSLGTLPDMIASKTSGGNRFEEDPLTVLHLYPHRQY